MKSLHATTIALGLLFMPGNTQEGQATVIQPIGSTTVQNPITPVHWRGRHHWHGGRHWNHGPRYWNHGPRGYWGGGGYHAPRVQRVCHWGPYGYSCHRRYY